FERIFLKYLRDAHESVDGAMELLSYLSGKYTVCIASNAPYDQQLHRLKQAGMLPYIQYLFISEKVGYPKPGRRFFDYCFSRLKTIQPKEAIIIGDSMTADIAGGIEYGMKTCWYNHDGAAVPDSPKADYVVTALEQIRNIL
ncbi:MAG: HAD-IA family hydrolase, partial [Coprococcus sp.]